MSMTANSTSRPKKFRLHVQEQDATAQVVRDSDGSLTLALEPGLISPRAYVAIKLALAQVGYATI